MDAKQKITKARTALILDQPFFGTLALRLNVREGPEAGGTMATNGVNLVYNADFVDGLTMDELKGVLCHEVMHLAAQHHCRRNNRDPQRWNISCDHAINHIITESGFSLPKSRLMDPQYKDMNAEHIYSKLPENPKGNGKGQGNKPSTGQAGEPNNPDPGGCGQVLDFPGEDGQKATPAEMAQQAQDWQIAATQAAQVAKAQGKLPGSLARLVEELNDAKVPWREVLQRFVNQCARNDYSWRRPSARYFSRGIILPSLYSEQLPPIVVAVDTSGSIGAEDLQQFASEIDEIIGQYNATVQVLYCDTSIAGEEEFTPETRPVRLQAKGGGGTDFAPVMKRVEEMDEAPACIVYLTDMCCSSFGNDPGVPVLWVATEGRNHKPPFGEVTYLG
jgi:predicted metal-dependent peptidase